MKLLTYKVPVVKPDVIVQYCEEAARANFSERIQTGINMFCNSPEFVRSKTPLFFIVIKKAENFIITAREHTWKGFFSKQKGISSLAEKEYEEHGYPRTFQTEFFRAFQDLLNKTIKIPEKRPKRARVSSFFEA